MSLKSSLTSVEILLLNEKSHDMPMSFEFKILESIIERHGHIMTLLIQ